MSVLLVGADLCPIGVNRPLFEAGDAIGIFHNLLVEFQQADFSIVNLECPFMETQSPIRKTGPTFGVPGACVEGIRNAGIDVLGLANNHIMDHGAAGLEYTLRVCAEAGIGTVGAGKDLAAARRMLIREVGGVRVGIIAMAEREFSIATREGWGANPLDVIDFVRNVAENRGRFDYLVALVHGGFEFAPYPSPRIRNTCRFLVEQGANAVFVQHTHCLGGYEFHQGGFIAYGQGAVIMDEAIYRDLAMFHEGYLAHIQLVPDNYPEIQLIPFRHREGAAGVERMNAEDSAALLEGLRKKSEAIADDAFIENEWMTFCRQREHGYVSSVLGHHRIVRKMNARGLIERLLYTCGALRGVRNCICCETHREALETIFDRLRRPR